MSGGNNTKTAHRIPLPKALTDFRGLSFSALDLNLLPKIPILKANKRVLQNSTQICFNRLKIGGYVLTKIDHIGIAVKNLPAAAALYEEIFHLVGEEVKEVPQQQVRVKKLTVGETKIELLEPTSEDSPVTRFLQKRGEGIHHICYAVPQFEKALVDIRAAGLQLIGEPTVGSDGKRVVFIHPKSTFGVLIELVEQDEPDTSK